MSEGSGPRRRLREPVQVYLDGRDRDLLDTLAVQASVPRSEILRMGLRRMGAELRGADEGSAFQILTGVLDGADVPRDLAARHDEYLYPPLPKKKRKKR